MSIERRFDVPFIAAMALREKAIQQNYRPVIAVHKWFARRPGTLFRGLLLSEFVDSRLRDSYFRSHDLRRKRIADPFMGGGTPLVEANRLGADIAGWDINPMAWWIVGRELERLDVAAYEEAGRALLGDLRRQVGELYETECIRCHGPAPVKYFLWVKTQPCTECDRRIDLFPGYLVATDARHPCNVFLCAECGRLAEAADRKSPGPCPHCAAPLRTAGPARRSLVRCAHCGASNSFPAATERPLEHRMFAIEYHCHDCRPGHRGRFFKTPDARDMANYDEAKKRWRCIDPRYVPDDPIPPGDESTRLHRWGYRRYRQMFNDRQLLGLETSCRLIATQPEPAVHRALATNLSDLLRYNNLLVRYDTRTLKALDLFSVHGFPTGLVRCEVNLLGTRHRNGKAVGSGGWINILDKYKTAKNYCDSPFEVAAGSRTRVYTTGERIEAAIHNVDRTVEPDGRVALLACDSATNASLAPGSLDAVLTDPPYYDTVQYAELMDFCYVWLRRLAKTNNGEFRPPSTRSRGELTGNQTEGRGLEHFTEGLAEVYGRMADALKPGAPLAFTYHHNRASAYRPVAVAILDAGLVATATLPCPAEMSGSIHINGTRSSIVDTVFVCRKDAAVPEGNLAFGPEAISQLVAADLIQLRLAGGPPCQGFSKQKRGAHKGDDRNRLVLEFARLVEELSPRFFLLENVAMFGQKRGREFVRRIRAMTRYRLFPHFYNSADYGLAQTRQRFIIVGQRTDLTAPFCVPPPTHRVWRTVGEVLKGLPEPPLDYSVHPSFPNHQRARVTEINVRRFSHVPPGGGWQHIPKELRLTCHRKVNTSRGGWPDVYGRLDPDGQAPTITGGFDSFSRGRYGHPHADRPLTPREAARLQGFPDDFEFVGTRYDVRTQIGNAVPPPLAHAIGCAIGRSLAMEDSLADEMPESVETAEGQLQLAV